MKTTEVKTRSLSADALRECAFTGLMVTGVIEDTEEKRTHHRGVRF